MLEKAISLLLCVTVPIQAHAKTLRELNLNDNQVAVIHTALGFSTILEFPTKPATAVLGDQDSFKLEYVGNSITLKPLVPHGKSNLFIFSEYHRTSFTLLTGSSSEVDYLVRINSPKAPLFSEKTAAPRPITINRKARFDGIEVIVRSALLPKRGDVQAPTVINFEIASLGRLLKFAPGSLGVKQGQGFLNIESLYVDSLELLPQRSVKGTLVLNMGNSRSPLMLVFAVPGKSKREKIHRILVPVKRESPPKKSEVKNGL